MKIDEASLLLAACIPLAERLDAGYVRRFTELNAEDRAVLSGFRHVQEAGWFLNPDIYQRAGLQDNDIANLLRMATALEDGKSFWGG